MSGTKKIRVIVIDDSALVRNLLTAILNEDPFIEVVASASDPYDAREKIKQYNPDVITLDIEMPKMNGLDFLEKIMTLRPMPVVMVSSLTKKGAEATLQALEMGAVETVGKPTQNLGEGMKELAAEIISKVKMASLSRPHYTRASSLAGGNTITHKSGLKNRGQVIAIGSSTGGVEAVREIFSRLPDSLPPILITQHMPANFMESFADRLDKASRISVAIAAEGMVLQPGHAYIAPGEKHLTLNKQGEVYSCHIGKQGKVSGHCPSVNVMFHSVAETVGEKSVAVILTGMGADGAEGMLAIRQAGGQTLGQNEVSCVVYGMPKKAYELGAVSKQVALKDMAQEIASCC